MKYLSAFLLFLCFHVSNGQYDALNDPNLNQDQKEAMTTVLELFKAYRNGDPEGVAATFAEGALLQRVTEKDGEITVTPANPAQGFVDYVAKNGKAHKHDEPVWDYVINIDGGLASVWVKYAFFLDDNFHHCGEENFLLVKKDKWQIFHLVDTSKEEGCKVPKEIKDGGGRI